MDEVSELWRVIEGFPRYSVSNLGRIMNVRTEELVKPQVAPKSGQVYVPLYEVEGGSSTRSVRKLVADAFVENPYDPVVFDTPINKDGDKSNNAAENLLWRPFWFAVKYSRQFHDANREVADHGPVFDTATSLEYETIFVVCIEFGLLFRDVYRSTYAEHPVFPTGQVFSLPNPIHVR